MTAERITLAALPCGCRVTDGDDDALHAYPCSDEHADDLIAAAVTMSLPVEVDD